ncbi:alpha/beta hydrolase family protein [Nonomuraea sp. NPDC048882]|uniref:alpha/beta hydrolase n=1 Tax=Nonomuraea sp. NPDC048882 TaxID=3154347 RepID=UPI0033F73212
MTRLPRFRGGRRTLPLLLAALLALCAGAGPALAAPSTPARAHVVDEQRVRTRVVDLTIDSPALGKTAKVRLLTPDGWQRRGPRDRWPVLYLLHGLGDSHRTWTRDSDVERLAALRDVLVVMPDAGFAGYYTDWWNKGSYGPPGWETFHLTELRRILERRYGAGERRAVAGLSMGGYGALAYAARHPGMFRAVASYSGPVHLLHPEHVRRWRVAFEQAPEYRDLWGDPVAQRAIWRRHDPYALARRLRPVPVFLSCGDGRPGPLDKAGAKADEIEAFDRVLNRSLAGRLERAGVRVSTHFYRGTHSPAYWERELHRSLPLLLGALRPAK